MPAVMEKHQLECAVAEQKRFAGGGKLREERGVDSNESDENSQEKKDVAAADGSACAYRARN